jgi:uncharacterized protein with NRDE domain
MCTVVLLRRPDHPWPIILGANRDEMRNRPWKPPARHWPDRHEVIAGLDELAGGTWMGLNDTGVVACILNRHGSLGPLANKRSRGELVLDALDHADATDAAKTLSGIDPGAYRTFNLIIADNRDAWWLALTAAGQETGAGVRAERIPPGLSMFTAGNRDDPNDARIAAYRTAFAEAQAPDPDAGDWTAWEGLFGATGGGGPGNAMSFQMEGGFGTSSSSLLALPSVAAAHATPPKRPIWRFAAGPPEATPYRPVAF